MKKVVFVRVVMILVVALVFALPASAQFSSGIVELAEPEKGVCVSFEIDSGPTENIVFFFGPTEFFLTGLDTADYLLFQEPFSTFEITLLVPNNSLVFMISSVGVIQFFTIDLLSSYTFVVEGMASVEEVDMSTNCLGAATDGRLNRFEQQMLAAIYRDGNGGYNIWAIDAATSGGGFDYNASQSQVNEALAAADASGEAQVIAAGSTSTFYALINGECQLNSPNASGEMQVYTFPCR